MRDFIGQELFEGDTVAVTVKGYRSLVRAEIVGFTPKNVKLKYRNHNGWEESYLTPPSFVVKINPRGDV